MNIEIITRCLTEMEFNGKIIEGFKVISMDPDNNPEGVKDSMRDVYGGGQNSICDYLHYEKSTDEAVAIEKSRITSEIINSPDQKKRDKFIVNFRKESVKKFYGSLAVITDLSYDYDFRLGGGTVLKFIWVIEGKIKEKVKLESFIKELNKNFNQNISGRLRFQMHKVISADDMLENYREYLTQPGFKK